MDTSGIRAKCDSCHMPVFYQAPLDPDSQPLWVDEDGKPHICRANARTIQEALMGGEIVGFMVRDRRMKIDVKRNGVIMTLEAWAHGKPINFRLESEGQVLYQEVVDE